MPHILARDMKRAEIEAREQEVFDFLKQYGGALGSKRERTVRHHLSVILARDQFLLQQIRQATEALFKKVPTAKPAGWALKKRHDKIERHLNLVLSDLHFGAALDGREVPVEYGSIEAARRLSKVILDAAEFKLQYRSETTLDVHLLGDIIQGQLHDLRDGNPLAEQVAEAQYLLCQAMRFLSTHFPQVRVFATPGNHGRNLIRHQERATIQKWDATELHIYHCLKMYCQHLPNVHVEIPRTPFITCKTFKHRIFLTHGDTVLKVSGNPQKSINIDNLVQQTNAINAGAIDASHRYGMFIIGHAHVGLDMRLPTGAWLVINPALIPVDGYAVSLGNLESVCGQTLIETVPGHVHGHSFISEVGRHVDRDRALDRIIAPYDGF